MSGLLVSTLLLNAVLIGNIHNTLSLDRCTSGSCAPSQSCCRGYSWHSKRRCRNVSDCTRRICYSDDDCDGKNECCKGTRCGICDECEANDDCGAGRVCCRRFSNVHSRCMKGSCIGERCVFNSDCGGPQQCCRSGRCVNCSDPGCDGDFECSPGQVCCSTKSGQDIRRCKESCIGQFCNENADCGKQGVCCRSNKCVHCSDSHHECYKDLDCRKEFPGYYCCANRLIDERNECRENCIDLSCLTDDDCAGEECCDRRTNKCKRKCYNGFSNKSLVLTVVMSSIFFLGLVGSIIIGIIFARIRRKKSARRQEIRSNRNLGVQTDDELVTRSYENTPFSMYRDNDTLRPAMQPSTFPLPNNTDISRATRAREARQQPTHLAHNTFAGNYRNEHDYLETLDIPPPPYSPSDSYFSRRNNGERPPAYTIH